MTPNIKVVHDWIVVNRPGYIRIGITNCRKIAGSQTYSQHSWPNALDIHCSKGYGDALAKELKERFEPHIYELLWWVPDHFDHIHVSCWPKGWLTPPCAGGLNRIKYEDGTVIAGPFPLTITEGEDNLDFIIQVLKGQNMAFYHSLRAKTGEPGGDPGYWGYDYTGQKPSDAEWRAAAPKLFGAALQAGVFAEIPAPTPIPSDVVRRGQTVQLS